MGGPCGTPRAEDGTCRCPACPWRGPCLPRLLKPTPWIPAALSACFRRAPTDGGSELETRSWGAAHVPRENFTYRCSRVLARNCARPQVCHALGAQGHGDTARDGFSEGRERPSRKHGRSLRLWPHGGRREGGRSSNPRLVKSLLAPKQGSQLRCAGGIRQAWEDAAPPDK